MKGVNFDEPYGHVGKILYGFTGDITGVILGHPRDYLRSTREEHLYRNHNV